MPDGTEPVKGAVLILSAEDGLADTIRPRLDAADGDADQVITITEITARNEDGEDFARPVTLPGDLPDIEKVIRRHGVVLVVVDVLMAYLSGAVDSYRDQDVRRALHPLAAMADRTGCTVLVLRHFSKTGGEKAVYRGGGSIGIIGAARAAFMCGTDPEDDTGRRRVLAPVKCNLSALPPSLAYKLVPDELRGCARVGWLGETPLTAAALLADHGTEDERGERDEAAKWLAGYLKSKGEASWADIRKAARADGIAERTLQCAHWRAGVAIRRSGFGKGSLWSLDPNAHHSRQPDGANGADGANDDGSPHSRQSRQQTPIENRGADGANETWPEVADTPGTEGAAPGVEWVESEQCPGYAQGAMRFKGTLGAEANDDEEEPTA
jgi:AAA domain